MFSTIDIDIHLHLTRKHKLLMLARSFSAYTISTTYVITIQPTTTTIEFFYNATFWVQLGVCSIIVKQKKKMEGE